MAQEASALISEVEGFEPPQEATESLESPAEQEVEESGEPAEATKAPLLKRSKGNSPVQLYYFESNPDTCLTSNQVKALLDIEDTVKAGPGFTEQKDEFLTRHLSEKILEFSKRFLDAANSNGYGTEKGTNILALIDALRQKKKEKSSTPADPYSAEAVAVYLSTREPNKEPEEMFEQLHEAMETKKDEILAVLKAMHRDPETGWLYRRVKATK